MNTNGKDIVDGAAGVYEFCPNLPDMVHDIAIQAGFPEIADTLQKELNGIMRCAEYVAFEGGGRIFIPVPKFLVEGASRLE